MRSRFATRSRSASPSFCAGGWGTRCCSGSSARERRARMRGRCCSRPRSTSGREDAAIKASDTAAVLREVKSGDTLLAQARSLDPAWVAVPTMRGTLAYRASRFFGDDQTKASHWIDIGLAHADTALSLAPDNPDALELRGTLRYWRYLLGLEPGAAAAKQLLDGAQADLEQAVKINPAQAGAWGVLSSLLVHTDDVTGAKLAARRAYDQDAFLSNIDIIVYRLFTLSLDDEQFTEAAHWCEVGGKRFPTDPRFVECQLDLLGTKAMTPDPALAWKLSDSVVKLTPESSRTLRGGEHAARGGGGARARRTGGQREARACARECADGSRSHSRSRVLSRVRLDADRRQERGHQVARDLSVGESDGGGGIQLGQQLALEKHRRRSAVRAAGGDGQAVAIQECRRKDIAELECEYAGLPAFGGTEECGDHRWEDAWPFWPAQSSLLRARATVETAPSRCHRRFPKA